MSEHTPNSDPQLEDVRGWYIDGRRTHNPFASNAELAARFDRWLAEYTAGVRAQALEDVADVCDQPPYEYTDNYATASWLRARAEKERQSGNPTTPTE